MHYPNAGTEAARNELDAQWTRWHALALAYCDSAARLAHLNLSHARAQFEALQRAVAAQSNPSAAAVANGAAGGPAMPPALALYADYERELTAISSDFQGAAREWLQQTIYHAGRDWLHLAAPATGHASSGAAPRHRHEAG